MDNFNFLIQNWALVVAVVALIGVCIWAIFQFVQFPTSKQIQKVQEWLLWAVTKAESELGSGTGQLKLRYVYDMFVEKFPAVAKMLSFDYFSMMVDKALNKMKEILNQNKAAVKLVQTGEKTVTGTKKTDAPYTDESDAFEETDEIDASEFEDDGVEDTE